MLLEAFRSFLTFYCARLTSRSRPRQVYIPGQGASSEFMVSGTRATEANGLLADYWVESRRPIASLAFIAPMLVAYEGGLIWLGNAGHYQFAFSLGAWRWGLVVGDAFSWTSFLFRAVAGVFFSVLFLYRGFGVAAGTHALYDIFATLV